MVLSAITEFFALMYANIMGVVDIYLGLLSDAFTGQGLKRMAGATTLGLTALGLTAITAGATFVVVVIAVVLFLLGVVEMFI